jgi:hypothetical protein
MADVLSRKRSVRYALDIPVLYRADGEQRWSEGRTIDVSSSGVLIAGELPVGCGGAITVLLPLPDANGCLTGRGPIVRVLHGEAWRDASTFAVGVNRFSIERASAALLRFRSLHQGC